MSPISQPGAAPPSLEQFFQHVGRSNPFDVNRLVPTAFAAEDAAAVHDAAFRQLQQLAGQAQHQPTGIGVVLWGEAGIGKSHVLARLGRWAALGLQRAVFVYLANLQAEPGQLPRSLLRCVVSILTRGRTRQLHQTPLFRLLNDTLRAALQDVSRTRSWREAAAAYQRLIDELCDRSPAQAALVDRPTYDVLFRFFRSAYEAQAGPDDGLAALAVRWLAGDFLNPEEAARLPLPPGPRRGDPVALADDQQIKNVLATLAQIAAYAAQPFILCFDQVDNLEAEQFAALARFLHALLDSATNLLVITAGVRETVLRFRERLVFHPAAWDRLAQHEVELQRVGVPAARQIVQARLQPVQEPFLQREPIRSLVQQDDLFPLGEAWAQEFLADKIEVRPRDVINWARTGWRREQEALLLKGSSRWLREWGQAEAAPAPPPEPPAEAIERLIDEKVAQKLHEHRRQRQQEPHTLPPDPDHLAGLLYSLLQQCLTAAAMPGLVDVDRPPRGLRRTCDLVLRQRLGSVGREGRTGLLCLVVSDRKSLAAALRRLAQDPQLLDRLVLVTEERRPLDPAAAGQEYLDQVRQRYGDQFHRMHLSFDQYAELDALQAVVGLARAGDLEIEPGARARRVSEAEVIASHHRQRRYLNHPLLRLLLMPEEGEAVEPGRSTDLVHAAPDHR